MKTNEVDKGKYFLQLQSSSSSSSGVFRTESPNSFVMAMRMLVASVKCKFSSHGKGIFTRYNPD